MDAHLHQYFKLTDMKNKILIGYASAIAIMLLTQSCKKNYGYSFEDGYSKTEVVDTFGNQDLDTSKYKIDRSQFNAARVFPGLLSISEPRIKNVKVTLDFDFVYANNANLRVSVPPQGWFSTGMYAPAGELVEIEVPAGEYGMIAQIGAWDDDLSSLATQKRAPIIYSRHNLAPGKNFIRNLYGGHVYVIPPRALGRKVDFTFTGTVKSPDFVLGETTDEDWKKMIAKSTVPFFELRGKRIIFTIPTSRLAKYPIESPTTLMQTWDDQILHCYWEWYGLSENAADARDINPMLPWRIVHDIQPSVGAQHSGYPVVATATDAYFQQAVTLGSVIGQNWGTYHEIGHNMQMNNTWSFDGNGEVTCNLFSLKVTKYNGFKHSNYKRMMTAALAYINATGTKSYTAESTSLDARLGMFIQILEKYGFEFITYLTTEARHARFTSNSNQDKIDFFYERLSEFTKKDMEPYLTKWGITVSVVSKTKISAKYPLLTEAVWLYDPS